jgi:ribonuclease T1
MPHHRMVRAGHECDAPDILPICACRNGRDHGVPMRRMTIPILVLFALAVFAWSQQRTSVPGPIARTATQSNTEASTSPTSPSHNALPPELGEALALIRRGGPFPHRQDGIVFENRERELPAQPRGYYHEYTVDTPGAHDRGARRIITGGEPPVAYYYTDDHYRSFRPLEPTR